MKMPTAVRSKSVKETVQRFVEKVSQLPQVEAVLLTCGEEGWEVQVVVAEPDLSVVNAVAEVEGAMIDRLGELPFLSDVVFRQGQPLENFLSPQTYILFRR